MYLHVIFLKMYAFVLCVIQVTGITQCTFFIFPRFIPVFQKCARKCFIFFFFSREVPRIFWLLLIVLERLQFIFLYFSQIGHYVILSLFGYISAFFLQRQQTLMFYFFSSSLKMIFFHDSTTRRTCQYNQRRYFTIIFQFVYFCLLYFDVFLFYRFF